MCAQNEHDADRIFQYRARWLTRALTQTAGVGPLDPEQVEWTDSATLIAATKEVANLLVEAVERARGDECYTGVDALDVIWSIRQELRARQWFHPRVVRYATHAFNG